MNNQISSSYSNEQIDLLLKKYKNDLDGLLKQIDNDANEYFGVWLDNYNKNGRLKFISKFRKKMNFIKAMLKIVFGNFYQRVVYRKNIGFPAYVIWTMLNQCVARCPFCHDGGEDMDTGKYYNKKGCMPLSNFAQEALINMSENVSGIYFCGGEPLLYPTAPALVQEASKKGMSPIYFNTNAILAGKKLLDDEYEAGNPTLNCIDYFIISVHSLNPETIANTFRSANGVYDAVNQLRYFYIIKKLQKPLNFILMTNTVVRNDNLADVEQILNWGEKQDIRMNFVPEMYGKFSRPAVFNNEKYIELAKEMLKRKKRGVRVYGEYRMIKKLLLGEKFNCFPTVRSHVKIDENGNYVIPFPCSGDPKTFIKVSDIASGKNITLKLDNKSIDINLKNKSWLSIIKILENNGVKMSCPTGVCYLAQDLSTELIYYFERSLLFLLEEIFMALVRFLNKK